MLITIESLATAVGVAVADIFSIMGTIQMKYANVGWDVTYADSSILGVHFEFR